MTFNKRWFAVFFFSILIITNLFIVYGLPSEGSGTLSVDGNLWVWDQLILNDYTFPYSDGDVNQILVTDGSGILGWADANITSGSGSLTGDYIDGQPLSLIVEDANFTAVNKTYTYAASTSMGFISQLQNSYNEPSLSSGKYTIITPDTKFKDVGGTTTIHSRESLDTDYVYVGQINASMVAFTSFVDYYKILVTDFNLGTDNWVATAGTTPLPTTTYTLEQLLSFRLDDDGFYTNIGITVGDRTLGDGTIDTDILNATNVNLLNLNATDGSFYFNPTVDEYPSGSGSRFIWDSTKSTIMAGTAYTDKWDFANVPSYSIIGGYSNSANSGAIVSGQGNTAGYNGASFGALTESSSHGLSSGSSTLASPYGFSAGYRTKGYGWANWVGGTGTIVEGDESFGFGGIHISGADSIAGPYVTANSGYGFGFNFTLDDENSFVVGFNEQNFIVDETKTYVKHKLGINTETPEYPLHVMDDINGISIYADANITAAGYITRTKVYDKTKGKATTKIKDADEYLNPDGSINHDAFGDSTVKYKIQKVIGYTEKITKKTTCIEEPIIDGINNDKFKTICTTRDVITQVPIYKEFEETGVSLDQEVALLKQAIYELKQCITTSKNMIKLNTCIEN